MTINKEEMGKNYEEMGLINLLIVNENFIAEHQAYISYEKTLKNMGELK